MTCTRDAIEVDGDPCSRILLSTCLLWEFLGKTRLVEDESSRRTRMHVVTRRAMKPLSTLSCEHFNFPDFCKIISFPRIGNTFLKVKAFLCRKYENRGGFRIKTPRKLPIRPPE